MALFLLCSRYRKLGELIYKCSYSCQLYSNYCVSGILQVHHIQHVYTHTNIFMCIIEYKLVSVPLSMTIYA